MALSFANNQLRLEKPRGHDVLGHHGSIRDALGDAGDRAKSSGTAAVAVAPTAFAEIALDFKDAKPYCLPVDVKAVRAQLLRDAAAKDGLDDDEIVEISGILDEQIIADHQRSVRAKQMDTAFRHGGRSFAAGGYVVQREDGGVEAYSAEEFVQLGAKLVEAKEADEPTDAEAETKEPAKASRRRTKKKEG